MMLLDYARSRHYLESSRDLVSFYLKEFETI